jgi:hypothetical protein
MFTNPHKPRRRPAHVMLHAGVAVAATAAFSGLSAVPAVAHPVPPGEAAPAAASDGATAARATGGPAASTIHVVARGESLSGIAAAYGYTGRDDWRHVYDANPTKLDDPNLIFAGLHLRIPTADERFVRRALPEYQPTVADTLPGARRPGRGVRASRSASAAPAAGGASTAGGEVWDRLAACESGGNWSTNTGNGYRGGLQFHPKTWEGAGGGQYAASAEQASRDQQIEVAKRVQASQGWKAWPACSRKLGLR